MASSSWLFATAALHAQRATRELQALYTFEDDQGDTVRDRSGTGQPLDLKIERADRVAWRDGALAIRTATSIVSTTPATKIVQAVKRSGEISIEAWMTPANSAQSGPARIVSLSSNSSQRNFTLGQETDTLDVRLRSTKTD
ncbi:MAG: hypothetical protein KDA45_15060, partial [Planctomycetales bacterium]|nr:hypothetical protein [Planctomycetales bacterium]